ncbi:MAG: YciI family protein [Thermomicrobiales bacterium]
MVLIYANPKNWEHPMFLHGRRDFSDKESTEMLAQFEKLMSETDASGEMKTAFALSKPSDARIVSAKSGQLLTTDGPFAEAKEYLAGTFIFECESLERAVELASRFPDVQFGAVEVRPIMEL